MITRPNRSIPACFAVAFFLAAGAARAGVAFEPDGAAALENDLVRIRVSNRPGTMSGIMSWQFKPLGIEMVDVLYGQTDEVPGHMLGETWDPVTMGFIEGQAPQVGSLYIPQTVGVSESAGDTQLTQITQAGYRLTRTILLRRDHALIEVRYSLENLTCPKAAVSLRLHTSISPGARGKYQRRDDTLFLNTGSGLYELDQTLILEKYYKKYGQDVFFFPCRSNEPPRWWVNPASVKTPPLKDNWAAWVNRANSDGMVFILDTNAFIGIYNCPGITIEPVSKAFALAQGQKWKASIFIGSFTGIKGRTVTNATSLYVEVAPLVLNGKSLAGEILPLWRGKLVLRAADGKQMFAHDVSPTNVVKIKAEVGNAWTLSALDTAGREIGAVNSSGRVQLREVQVSPIAAKPPSFMGKVYAASDSRKQIEKFLAPRDFTIHCSADASEPEREMAGEIARLTGAGLAWTPPGGKMLVIGTPQNNTIVREAGLLKGSVTEQWPGNGKGAILDYENFEGTRKPLLLVAGSDSTGAVRSCKEFIGEHLAAAQAPTGFVFWAASPAAKVFPYTRPESTPSSTNAVRLKACRGEYETAQVIITARGQLADVTVSNSPLIHTGSGKPISGAYLTSFRRVRAPIWTRWVNMYPSHPDRWQKGWCGMPDPLLERPETTIKAGDSQAIWLTFIVPDTAPEGVYTSSVTCAAGGSSVTIPIELEGWPFNLPQTGLMGEPFTDLYYLPGDIILTPTHVNAWTVNMVEHGMRVLHMPRNSIRWQFSPEGKYKAMDCDWLTASDDGVIALDHSTIDELLEAMDKAAAPFKLRITFYNHFVLYPAAYKFSQLMPQRYADKPESKTKNYYVLDMLRVFRKYLDKRGLMPRVCIKVGDEPMGFDTWWFEQAHTAVEAGLPVVTAFNTLDYTDARKGIGKVKEWMPLYMIANVDFLHEARKAGDLTAWYNCGPRPKISTSATASEIRAYIWQAAKADLDIISWWGIQCWTADQNDVWENRYSHRNSVVYPRNPEKPAWIKPGRGWVDVEPIDSIRWELIREGMEDAWYVNLLRTLIVQAREQKLDDQAKKAQAVLDGVWAGVFPTLNDYDPPYERILESREKIAGAIIELQAALAPPPAAIKGK